MLQTIQHAHDVLTEKGLSPYYSADKHWVALYAPTDMVEIYLAAFYAWFPDMYTLAITYKHSSAHITIWPKEMLFQKIANVIDSCQLPVQIEMAAAYAERSRYKDDPVISSLIAKKAAELK